MSIRVNFAITLLGLYSIVLALSNSLHVSMFLPLILEIYRNKNDILIIFKKLALLNLFISIISISIYFSNPNLAFLIFIRSNMIVLFALLLLSNKTYFDIAYGLQKLKLPPKISSLFYLSAKFIFLLFKEIKIFNKNLLLRGFKPKVNIFTYKTYANFIGLFFIQALNKAENINNTLILRGFNGKIYSLKPPKKITNYEIILTLVTIFSLIFKKGYFI